MSSAAWVGLGSTLAFRAGRAPTKAAWSRPAARMSQDGPELPPKGYSWSEVEGLGFGGSDPGKEPLDSAAPVFKVFAFPGVQYTVPSQVIGWKGRPGFGEDPAIWYDVVGARNGPPPNYWRQNADERYYKETMEAVAAAVGPSPGDEKLLALELRMGIKNPLRNRKLLGEWLPLIVRGHRVGSIWGDYEGVATPVVVTIRRVGERKTREHTYGTLDLPMEDGEPLLMSVRSLAEPTKPPMEGVFSARSGGGLQRVVFDVPNDSTLDWMLHSAGVMDFGDVSLLSDYLLVRRSPSGELLDLYLRRDARGRDDVLATYAAPWSIEANISSTGIDGALDRSRELRSEFRNQFFTSIKELKLDMQDILTREPNWDNFAEDFELVDREGVVVKGLGVAKVLLRMIRDFRTNMSAKSLEGDLKVNVTKIPRPPIKAQWNYEISVPLKLRAHIVDSLAEAKKREEFPGYDMESSGEATFSFNTEGKWSRMKLDACILNGNEAKFPPVRGLPDLSGREASKEEAAEVEAWASRAFLGVWLSDGGGKR